MSDISPHYSHLTKTIEATPIYVLENQAVKTLISEYGNRIKSDGNLIHQAIYKSETLLTIYQEVFDNHGGEEALEKFKKRISRNITCSNAVIKSTTIGKIERQHHTCGSKGCFNTCLPYKSNEVVHYHDSIIRFVVVIDNNEEALRHTDEIKNFFEERGWSEFVVRMTPGHDGRDYIRISCLASHRLNILIDDNETKARLREIDDRYPHFEEVTRVSPDGSRVSTYQTKNNLIQFSSSDLYATRSDGQSGSRERGTKPGFSFNSELDEIEYTSIKARKQQKDEAREVVGKKDTLSFNINVDEEKLEKAVDSTIRDMSANSERTIFVSRTAEDALNLNAIFVAKVISNLEVQGEYQPYMPFSNSITKKDLEEFNDKYAVEDYIPQDILEVEFTDEMMGIGTYSEEKRGLSRNINCNMNQRSKTMQDKVLEAPTIEEFVSDFMDTIRKLKKE